MRTPPRLACRLLRLRLSRSSYEAIAGDLVEAFHKEGRTAWWFWRQTLSTLAPNFGGGETSDHSEGAPLMTLASDLLQDIRYSARTLRKNPNFAFIAIVALALGIGVNTGIFTVLNAVALRPLPVAEAGRVVSVYQQFRGQAGRSTYGSASYFSYPEYLDYRDHNHVFSGLAAYATATASLGGVEPRRLSGQLVSCNFFTVAGRPPVLGRDFAAGDCARPDTSPVVILSHALWKAQFQGDPAVLGSTILLNRRAFTVIGIGPAEFTGIGANPSSYWAPVTMQGTLLPASQLLADANTSWLEMLGRLKPGVSVTRARADLGVIAGRIDRLYPGRTTTLTIGVATLLGEPEARTIVLAGGTVALLAVGLVLLIACANVANLLLSRAAARQKEIAIRLSTGASRGRIVRQLLTESLLIALAGGALGSVFALWTVRALFQLAMSSLPAGVPPIVLDLSPDVHVFGYALALSAITGMFFGLAPALQATRPNLLSALKEEGAGFAGAQLSRGWLRNGLVVAQVAVCLVLLIAAGLLARGLQSAQRMDPGLDVKGVVTAEFDLEQQGYNEARARQFHRQLMERVAALPGVDAVSQAGVAPLEGSSHGTAVEVPGLTGDQQVKFNQVSPAFFSLLGMPILRGRGFTQAEAESNARVAVISEATAKRFWPNQDAVGKSFRWNGDKLPAEVIGVTRDVRYTDLAHVDQVYFYLPVKLELEPHMRLLVHTNGSASATARLVREAAHSLDPNLIVTAKPVEDNLEFWRQPSRILAILTGSIGLLGLLLASVGIYGVVSYAVSQRSREIGIRMTLGADASGILGLVLRQAMSPVAVGIAIGFVVCAAASRMITVMLYGVSPLDPLTFGGVALFLAAIALAACYIPARRATRVDPIEALRYE